MSRAMRIFIGLSIALTVQQGIAQENWTGMRALNAMDCAEKIQARYESAFGKRIEHWDRAVRTSGFYGIFVEECTEGRNSVLFFSEQATVQSAVCHFNLREFRQTVEVLIGDNKSLPVCGLDRLQ